MAKPWEKYAGQSKPQAKTQSQSGPWEKYSGENGDYWKSSLIGGEDVKPDGFAQNLDYGMRKLGGMALTALDIPNQIAGRPIRMMREALTGRADPNPPQGFIQEVTGGIQGLSRIPTAMMQGQSPSDALQTASQEVTRTKDRPMDVVNQLGFSLAAPQVAASPYSAIGKVAKPLLKPARSLGRKIVSFVGGVPEESVSYRANNVDKVARARNVVDVAEDDLPRVAKKYDERVAEFNKAADKAVSRSRYIESSADDAGGAFTKEEVIGAVDTARKKLGGIFTKGGETASKTLRKIKTSLSKKRSTVSQSEVRDFIKKIDDEIPWEKARTNPQDLTAEDTALINVRKKLDSLLKEKNPEYREIMADMSKTIGERNEFLKNFKLKRSGGGEYEAGNTTSNALAGSTRENRLATRRILGKTKKTLGDDLAENVKADQVGADFEADPRGVFNEVGPRQLFGRPLAGVATDAYGIAKQGYKKFFRPYAPAAPLLERAVLTFQDALDYLRKSDGDPNEARRLAIQDGKEIPN